MRHQGRALDVFLSHTEELRRFPAGTSFVEAAEQAVLRVGDRPVDMAQLTAGPTPPAEECQELVRRADVYLGILGFRYGSRAPEHPTTSYTEMEFETALEAGKRMLVFLLDEDADDGRESPPDAEQEEFRDRARHAGIVVATAATPDALATLVVQALFELPRERAWRVPPRNQVFSGREDLLARLRARDAGAVQVLHGMGGIGKSSLVIEHAHRHAEDYDVVWWVRSADPASIPSELAACARALGIASGDDAVDTAVDRLRGFLRDRSRWLLCYDNADDPKAVREHLWSWPGHVIITSRNPGWAGIAQPGDVLEVAELPEADAVSLLRARATDLADHEARAVAAALGRLPLALAQAGALLAETGMPAAEFLTLLEQQSAQVVSEGSVGDYPTSFAATWELAFDRLAETHPAALQFMEIGAYLAPEPIPQTLVTDQAALLPEPLAATAGGRLEWRKLVGVLRTQALARADTETVELHRLVQAVLRNRCERERGDPAAPGGPAATAAALLRSGVPADPWDAPETWASWESLFHHVDAVTTGPYAHAGPNQAPWLLDRAATFLVAAGRADQALPRFARARSLLEARLGADHLNTLRASNNVALGLAGIGEAKRARDLYEPTRERCLRVLGEDHPETLRCANDLAITLADLGETERAEAMYEETLERRRAVLGDEHAETLSTANNLALTLAARGRHHRARDLYREILKARRRALGKDHPQTLGTADNLALTLAALGDTDSALSLHRDTLDRAQRALGADHPGTLTMAHDLAGVLVSIGENEKARDLYEDTLTRRRRVLGENHRDTLDTADGLAATLEALGEHERARALSEDTEKRRRLR